MFDGYLDALSRAGLVSISQDTFTNAEGTVINYKRATLTGEGREHTGGARIALQVMLKDAESPSATTGKGRKNGGASRSSGSTKAGGKTERDEASAAYSPEQKALETRLREWRKAEAAKTGKPSFIIFSDSVLHALVIAQPRSISSLLTVSGIGPEKADRYGAAIVALMTGAEVPGNFGEPVAVAKAAKPLKAKAAPGLFASAKEPRAVESRPAEAGVQRKRAAEAEPAESLTAEQQALDHRLRDWRKAESEKLGLPQFFVLGSSALRSIVLERPRTLGQLEKIEGLGARED